MQTPNPLSERPNLSHDLGSLLREMIVDGRLRPGERINEVRLAASLGVSRTPLREALAGLANEGSLARIPRRGFTVCGLTAEEARHIYPIRALLDPQALMLAGIPPASDLDQLAAIGADLRTASEPELAIRLDDLWHTTLWARCPNPILIELIEQFMLRTRRYELASMRGAQTILKTTESKSEIVQALRNDDLARACSLLKQSLSNGLIPVLEWLNQSGSELS